MALYLARYLNVPPASLPGESGDGLNDLPIAAEEISAALLDTFDRQRQIDAAARLVARHLTLGHSPDALIATLAQALLREDAGFHAYQMPEAGVRTDAERVPILRYSARRQRSAWISGSKVPFSFSYSNQI